MKQKLFILLLVPFLILCKDKTAKGNTSNNNSKTPEKNYLSEDWARFRVSQAKTDKNAASLLKESKAQNAKGFAEYKQKKDAYAIPYYEQAIDAYPTGEAYYNYGNSLSNVNKLEDSIKAYRIALILNPPRPELAMYNIACSYSRLNKIDEAYANLALAIDRGYNAFEYIKKDADLENVRNSPDWEEKIKAMKNNFNPAEELLYGVVTEQGPRVADKYILCSTGVVLSYSEAYCPNVDYIYKKGYWKLDSGDVRVQFTETCSPSFESTAAEKENYQKEQMGSPYDCGEFFGKPKFKKCEQISGMENPNALYEISRESVKAMLKKTNTSDMGEFYTIAKFKGDEPKQCNPDFKPEKLEDLKLE